MMKTSPNALSHSMTGCDANSCFCGHGKSLLYGKMAKSPEACSLLLKCGENLPLNDDDLDDLKSYVIRYRVLLWI